MSVPYRHQNDELRFLLQLVEKEFDLGLLVTRRKKWGVGCLEHLIGKIKKPNDKVS